MERLVRIAKALAVLAAGPLLYIVVFAWAQSLIDEGSWAWLGWMIESVPFAVAAVVVVVSVAQRGRRA